MLFHPAEFETSEGAAEEGATTTYESVVEDARLEATAPVEEAATEEAPVEEAAAPEEPPTWFKEYLDRTEPVLGQLREALQPPPPQQQQVDLSQLDMQNPEHVQWLVNYQIQQAMSPYEPIMGMTAEQQGRDVANKFFDQLEPEVGKFDREQALTHYTALMAENPGAQPEEVLQYAARQVATYEQKVREDAIAEYKAQEAEDATKLRNLADAKTQPAAGTGAALENEEMPTGRDKYEVLANRWQSRQDRSGLGV